MAFVALSTPNQDFFHPEAGSANKSWNPNAEGGSGERMFQANRPSEAVNLTAKVMQVMCSDAGLNSMSMAHGTSC
ncbi:MAG: hypothetical protein LLF96_10840 [Eubacteriales bacterium]|nr:hypothetical protein [Eubacteriales bacterium]